MAKQEATLAEIIEVWREHRKATTYQERMEAKQEIFEFLIKIKAHKE